MSLKKTGIFATSEEIEKARELAIMASNTPVISLSIRDSLYGNDFATRMWRSAHEYCHSLAIKKGLPEIKGYYGIAHNGEFVSFED